MKYLKPLYHNLEFKYNHLVGTGGIGSGIFFRLIGNNTIGRNESRLGELLRGKDYCKLHIVIHYLAILLGTKKNKFDIFPIGKVGDDDAGVFLIKEIQKLGINIKNIFKIPNTSTLFSVCFQYPDSTGGNITSANSASSKVSEEDIISFFNEFKKDPKREIILSLPEVPLSTRIKILEIGRSRGSFNIGSVSSFEIKELSYTNGFALIDMIILNIDEASSIAKLNNYKIDKIIRNLEIERDVSKIIKSCISYLINKNINIMIVITNSSKGSYTYFKRDLRFIPVVDVNVKTTAGAGDAFLAGTIAGICCGLSFNSSVELGSFLASLSVISEDTINHEINLNYLKKFVEDNNISFSTDLGEIFK